MSAATPPVGPAAVSRSRFASPSLFPLGPARRLLSSRLGWLLLVLVAALALGIGSVHPVPPSRATRIAGLEAAIKCPSCADLTIGESNAAAAIDLRNEVVAMVDAGDSDATIKARVVAQYGPSVLEVPSGGDAGTLVWALPIALVAIFALGLGVFLWRRRRAPAVADGLDEDEALVAAARAGGGGQR